MVVVVVVAGEGEGEGVQEPWTLPKTTKRTAMVAPRGHSSLLMSKNSCEQ